jgi:hypothetical protein
MSPDKGGAVDPWWISLGTVCVGWAATIVIFIYTKGKERGRTDAKIEDLEKKLVGVKVESQETRDQMDNDREAFRQTLKESREEFQASLRQMERMFVDSNGNPRLMSVNAHLSHCGLAQKICGERFENIVKSQDKFSTEQIQRDHEIFKRLRDLESIPGEIGKLRSCFESYAKNASGRMKEVSERLDKHIEVVSASRRDHERT